MGIFSSKDVPSSELNGGIAERDYTIRVESRTSNPAFKYINREMTIVTSQFEKISDYKLQFSNPPNELGEFKFKIFDDLTFDTILSCNPYLIHNNFLVCDKNIYAEKLPIDIWNRQTLYYFLDTTKGKECCYIFYIYGTIHRYKSMDQETISKLDSDNRFFTITTSEENKDHILYTPIVDDKTRDDACIRCVKKLEFLYDSVTKKFKKVDDLFIVAHNENIKICRISDTVELIIVIPLARVYRILILDDNSIVTIDTEHMCVYSQVQKTITNIIPIEFEIMTVATDGQRVVMNFMNGGIMCVDNVHSKVMRKITIDSSIDDHYSPYTLFSFVPNTSILVIYRLGYYKDGRDDRNTSDYYNEGSVSKRDHYLFYAYDVSLNKRLCRKVCKTEFKDVVSFSIFPCENGVDHIYGALVESFRELNVDMPDVICKFMSTWL